MRENLSSLIVLFVSKAHLIPQLVPNPVIMSPFFRFWVNATKGMYGYVLASLDGNAVNFALVLNTTGSTTIADFFYLSNKVQRS